MNEILRRDHPRKTDLLNMKEEKLERVGIGHTITFKKILEELSPLDALPQHRNRYILFPFKSGVALHN